MQQYQWGTLARLGIIQSHDFGDVDGISLKNKSEVSIAQLKNNLKYISFN